MIPSLIVAAVTCAVMIASILFFPKIKLGKLSLDSYWVVVLAGAVVMLVCRLVSFRTLWRALSDPSPINPLKILILFLSMTLLSVFLDEVGFFRYLANKALLFAGKSQVKMFATVYWTVSLLTVFTSNDVVVLTFTPFLCYFAKNAKIDPKPYLIAEFVAANTMSMMLMIGNPTNIYIATSYEIAFADYFLVMALPTLASATLSFALLYLVFHKSLREPVLAAPEVVRIEDKPMLALGLSLLLLTTALLVVGPYVGAPMWLISAAAVGVLVLAVLILCAARKTPPKELGRTLRRAPWQLVPFVLGMFVLILALEQQGVTAKIGSLLGAKATIAKYGALSFLSANVINNIPMSVLFCPIVGTLPAGQTLPAAYATVIGSNLGAFLTPIGALAGIMWLSLLKKHDIKMGYLDFIKYGAVVAVPSLATALAILALTV